MGRHLAFAWARLVTNQQRFPLGKSQQLLQQVAFPQISGKVVTNDRRIRDVLDAFRVASLWHSVPFRFEACDELSLKRGGEMVRNFGASLIPFWLRFSSVYAQFRRLFDPDFSIVIVITVMYSESPSRLWREK
jgi:hypothetical protein